MSTERRGDEPDKSARTAAAADDAASGAPNLNGDWSNFFLLLLLYAIQGLPIGFIVSIPVLLQSNRNVTYRDQALFSLVSWPYTLKLLWAPLVDALYVRKIGRRKTWLVPIQFLIGLCFVCMARDIDNLLPETGKPEILQLVYAFFVVIFMVATQDIVVDGWALTMLKKNNVGYASTCNTSGLAIGSTIGSVCSALFTSEEFCNEYLRFTPGRGGIVSLKSLLYIWGVTYMAITVLIAAFKTEIDHGPEDGHVKLDVVENYALLWDILKLPRIRILAMALLTVKIGFAATDNVTSLQLIDAGIPKDNVMIMNIAMYVIKMVIPLVVAKHTSGPKPMCIVLKMILIRLFWNITFVVLVYYTPQLIRINGIVNIPMYYYAILVFIFFIQEILSYIIFIAFLSFFSRISDPRFGGTYMTLLNTLANFGVAWSSVVVLGLVDVLTSKECSSDADNRCSTVDLQTACKTNGGGCVVKINGYYVEVALCTVIGIVWYRNFRNILKNLQGVSPTQWLVNSVKQRAPVTKNTANVFTITTGT